MSNKVDKQGTLGLNRATRVRDAIIIKEKLAGATNTQAMRKAGYAETTVYSQAPMRRINGELCTELQAQGLTTQAFAGSIIEGLKATSPIISRGEIVKDEDGKERFIPDFRARATYAKLVAEVSGDLAPRKVDASGSITLDVNVKREEATAVWGQIGKETK